MESVTRTLNPVNQDRVPDFNPLRDLFINRYTPDGMYRSPQRRLPEGPAQPAISSAERNRRYVNETIVKKYFQRLFELDNRLVLAGHFYPMAGVLLQYPVQLLGHLSSFEKDWTSISSQLLGQVLEYDFNMGIHRTSVNYPMDKVKGKCAYVERPHDEHNMLPT